MRVDSKLHLDLKLPKTKNQKLALNFFFFIEKITSARRRCRRLFNRKSRKCMSGEIQQITNVSNDSSCKSLHLERRAWVKKTVHILISIRRSVYTNIYKRV